MANFVNSKSEYILPSNWFAPKAPPAALAAELPNPLPGAKPL